MSGRLDAKLSLSWLDLAMQSFISVSNGILETQNNRICFNLFLITFHRLAFFNESIGLQSFCKKKIPLQKKNKFFLLDYTHEHLQISEILNLRITC